MSETLIETPPVEQQSKAIFRQVHIRRKEPQSHLPALLVANARRIIGSHFVNRQPLKGLTDEQERKYLPRLIGVSPGSVDWDDKVMRYWANMTLDVPKDGVVLDISLRADGEPVNLEDWIRFNWVQKHMEVAENEEEMKRVSSKRYYIFDPEVNERKKNDESRNRMRAYQELRKIIDNEEDDRAIDRMIRVLRQINPANLNRIQKENALEEIALAEPDKFYAVATNKKLNIQAAILEMIEYGTLRKLGNHILFGDDLIGTTMEEAVVYMEAPSNATTVQLMKANLNEKRKLAS